MVEILTPRKEYIEAHYKQLASDVAGLMFAEFRKDSDIMPSIIQLDTILRNGRVLTAKFEINEQACGLPAWKSPQNTLDIHLPATKDLSGVRGIQPLGRNIREFSILHTDGVIAPLILTGNFVGANIHDEPKALMCWSTLLEIKKNGLILTEKVDGLPQFD